MAKKSNKPLKKTTKAKSKIPRTEAAQEPPMKLDSVWRLSLISLKLLWKNRKLFSGMMLIYGAAYIILVRGISSGVGTTSSFNGSVAKVFSGIQTFGLLVSNSSSVSTNPAGSSYQAIMIILISLIVIWTLRQLYAGSAVKIRDGYYKALFPLIPFILILLLIAVELLPMVLGSAIYNIVISESINVNVIEKLLGLIILLGLVGFSLYLISGSIFALYIVTLPDMTPVKALRSARDLVKGRRALVMRKVLFLPIAIIVATSIILLPFIFIYEKSTAWVLFVLSLGVIVMVHTYLYNLYRELIK